MTAIDETELQQAIDAGTGAAPELPGDEPGAPARGHVVATWLVRVTARAVPGLDAYVPTNGEVAEDVAQVLGRHGLVCRASAERTDT